MTEDQPADSELLTFLLSKLSLVCVGRRWKAMTPYTRWDVDELVGECPGGQLKREHLAEAMRRDGELDLSVGWK